MQEYAKICISDTNICEIMRSNVFVGENLKTDITVLLAHTCESLQKNDALLQSLIVILYRAFVPSYPLWAVARNRPKLNGKTL